MRQEDDNESPADKELYEGPTIIPMILPSGYVPGQTEENYEYI
jgi:hypothetical protein